jgi:hypothetical protein
MYWDEFDVEEVPEFYFILARLKTSFLQLLFFTCFHHVDIKSRWIPPRLFFWDVTGDNQLAATQQCAKFKISAKKLLLEF